MENIIREKLSGIEKEMNVRILYACESGSRAWGFASSDSDFDVRFIYAAHRDDYLSIREQRDVIEVPVNEVLDISGWDLRKTLRLFLKSNAPLYEWLQSPVCYRQHDDFAAKILQLMPDYFSNRAGCHHYLSMAANTFENDLHGGEVRLKKYFYALRPALAALWIVNNETLPPMEFRLLRTQVDDEPWQDAVDALLALKIQSNEKTMVPSHPLLHQWLQSTLDYCRAKAMHLQPHREQYEPLDNMFRKFIAP
ncbi:nucleotidyltransferase domain-containing protein [Chitinophaga lutea]|uniref:Nucleotidyltransferase domain-containing protein n=1 Tax=Chitinophaga lutea TaxID=2488634 RepID=A0A3N4QAU5_9BACT|nr:nucleotidyltransferase domain-containing protein [Chitinophaga lutea]RPE13117.1 nucleotidyltransferase domain-containing protein [Chitinophaga lutea]